MQFGSDNHAPALPEVLAALGDVRGCDLPYGEDQAHIQLKARIRRLFDAPDAIIGLVNSGTAANSLAFAVTVPPWGAVFASPFAHILLDECGAPSVMNNGMVMQPVTNDPGHEAGKIEPETLARAIALQPVGFFHRSQPGAVQVTQMSELGGLYTFDEIQALAAVAHAPNNNLEHAIPLHMDGARFASAVVHALATDGHAIDASDSTLADILPQLTWRAGVDVLTLGLTKCGGMSCEVMIFFNRADSVTSSRAGARARESLLYHMKRFGHVTSKARYLAAQALAMLDQNRWLQATAHAHAMARQLHAGLMPFASQPTAPPVGNIVITVLPVPLQQRLREAGAVFHTWKDVHPDAIRLVTHYATTPEELAQVQRVLQQG